MTLDDLIKKWADFSNFYMNSLGFWKYCLKEKENSILLKENEKFKNKHAGKRCFILGNGPSLNAVDFKLLENEYVFTVNELMRHKEYSVLKSNYHLIMDPYYFKEANDEYYREKMTILKKIKDSHNSPILFVPIEARNNIKNAEWAEMLEVHYICGNLYFCKNFDSKIHFERFVPRFQVVIQWAIGLAVYMGFEEIYLLGCDTTDIINVISTKNSAQQEINNYAYEYSYEKFKNFEEHKNDFEQMIHGFSRMLEVYEEIKKWCDKLGIKLINCSGHTILESIPRERLEKILNIE